MTFVHKAVLLATATAALSAQTKTVSDAEVQRVHQSAILVDGHNDVTSFTVTGLAIGPSRAEGHTDIPRLKKGGVSAVFFAAYVGTEYIKDKQAAHRAMQMIDTVKTDIVAKYPNEFVFVTTAAGILDAKKRGKMAALIGIEGGHAIEEDLRLLRDFYDLGVRYMTLTHSQDLSWAGSSGGTTNLGLNDFGKSVVLEMNRLGMLVDISHVSDQTMADVLAVATAPVIASHSSARAVSNIRRNVPDALLQQIGRKGGVVMVNFGCEFLSQKSADGSAWTNPALKGKSEKDVPRASINDVVAQIDHIKQVAGIDAIGIGSDFDGVTCTPEGLDDVSKFPDLTRKLLERGYTAPEIRKIYGGNVLRVMRAVEATAAKART